MKIENKDHLIHLINNVNQQIELLDEHDMSECPDMEDYEFLKKEFNKLIELDPATEFPYWIRLHSTAEHLISQI
jgi:hypothetical protein|tara:strand:- start:671 stop:892 length:222 start_codon:yes stop_codon:yes gene_type:complete